MERKIAIAISCDHSVIDIDHATQELNFKYRPHNKFPWLKFWIAYNEMGQVEVITETLALSTWGTVSGEDVAYVDRSAYLTRADDFFLVDVDDAATFFFVDEKVGSIFNPDTSPLPCFFPFHERGFWPGAARLGIGEAEVGNLADRGGAEPMQSLVGDIACICVDCQKYNVGLVVQAAVPTPKDPSKIGRAGIILKAGAPDAKKVGIDWDYFKFDYLHEQLSDDEPGKLSLTMSCWLSQEIDKTVRETLSALDGNPELRYYRL